MIYQLRDDILDVVATDNELGKPAGQDLAEGIYNLPTIFALRDANVGDELRGVLGAVARRRGPRASAQARRRDRRHRAHDRVGPDLPRPGPRRLGDAAERSVAPTASPRSSSPCSRTCRRTSRRAA